MKCVYAGLMATLMTDFIKVAQAGPSCDGREIREEWLREMAESYNPATYTAMLWPEHCRWWGNLGEVAELQAGTDDAGAFCLFARLKPNASLLEYNAAGQGLFYSIEVEENFAKSGKTYLGGLGVTDSPASLGLTSARFAKAEGSPAPQCFANVGFDAASLAPKKTVPGQGSSEEAPGWFKNIFPKFFNSNGGETPAETEDSAMDEIQAKLDEIAAALAALTEQVTALTARVDTLEVDAAANEGGEPESSDPAYKALAKHVGKFSKDLAELKTLFSTAVKGTTPPANTGPAGKKLL